MVGQTKVKAEFADEIEQLPSMTPAFAAILLPAVTVFNPNGRFDATRLRRAGSGPGHLPALSARIGRTAQGCAARAHGLG